MRQAYIQVQELMGRLCKAVSVFRSLAHEIFGLSILIVIHTGVLLKINEN